MARVVLLLIIVGLASCGSSKPSGGAPGAAGTTGIAGTIGTAGTGGDAGTTGAAGTSGQAGGGGAGASGASGTSGAAGSGAAGTTGGAGTGAAGSAVPSCVPVEEQHLAEGAAQVACTSPPTYVSKPPSSGNHYAIWADYRTYDKPVAWGHLVHSIKHGAIVIVYNCPGGCPDEVAAAQAMIDALPVDALCVAPAKRRVILAPDPTLDVRWAASAWFWTLRGSCFDAPAFRKFAADHYAQTNEDFCDELHEPLCVLP